MRACITTALLVVLALAHMIGDVAGIAWLKDLAAATCASPAPKMFCAARGLEAFSTRFYVEWQDARGEHAAVEIDAATYARLRGPYDRRSVYGAALAHGPVLASDARTQPMLNAVLRHALCPPHRLLAELGIDARGASGPISLRYVPRAGATVADLPLVLAVQCP